MIQRTPDSQQQSRSSCCGVRLPPAALRGRRAALQNRGSTLATRGTVTPQRQQGNHPFRMRGLGRPARYSWVAFQVAVNVVTTLAFVGVYYLFVTSAWDLVERTCEARLSESDLRGCGAFHSGDKAVLGRGCGFERDEYNLLLEASRIPEGEWGRFSLVEYPKGCPAALSDASGGCCRQLWSSGGWSLSRAAVWFLGLKAALLFCEVFFFVYDVPRLPASTPALLRSPETLRIVMQRVPAPVSLLIVTGACKKCLSCALLATLEPSAWMSGGRRSDSELFRLWITRSSVLDSLMAVVDCGLLLLLPVFVYGHVGEYTWPFLLASSAALAGSLYRSVSVVWFLMGGTVAPSYDLPPVKPSHASSM